LESIFERLFQLYLIYDFTFYDLIQLSKYFESVVYKGDLNVLISGAFFFVLLD